MVEFLCYLADLRFGLSTDHVVIQLISDLQICHTGCLAAMLKI